MFQFDDRARESEMTVVDMSSTSSEPTLNSPLFNIVSRNGNITFSESDSPEQFHKFLHFKILANDRNKEKMLSAMVEDAFRFVDLRSELVISVTGGFKRMKISDDQKINFKQGLIEIMKRNRIVIITGGFDVGVHKLVAESVRDFRSIHPEKSDNVRLIGICTFGVIHNREQLLDKNNKLFVGEQASVLLPEFTYDYVVRTVNLPRGSVPLDPNCDYFIFCDDNSIGEYDKEVEFRLEFQKYAQAKGMKSVVEILFEGGSRAFKAVHESVKNKIPIVIYRDSGRAANIISEVFMSKDENLETNINKALSKFHGSVWLQDDYISQIKMYLKKIFQHYHKQIFIYDMNQSNMKFGKKILEAFISSLNDSPPEKRLALTILFDCAEIANLYLGSDYSKIDDEVIRKHFINALKNDNAEFVTFFLEHGLNIDGIIKKDLMNHQYKGLKKMEPSLYNHIFMIERGCDINEEERNIFFLTNKIVTKYSGNILTHRYAKEYAADKESNQYGIRDLFLWVLLGCRLKLAPIFWKLGKDHVSSALIGAIILKNMAEKAKKLGDNDLYQQLKDSSNDFQNRAYDVLTEAYKENRKKAIIILSRELDIWNKTTCLKIAISGELIKFLSHKACVSYSRKLWRGELSPFIPNWKIVLNIPFGPLFIRKLILQNTSVEKLEQMENKEVTSSINIDKEKSRDDGNMSGSYIIPTLAKRERLVPYGKAIKLFYKAPIVKFYLNFASYITFLVAFAYMNLVELKSRSEITSIVDMKAEIFVYIYFLTIISEEIRQFIVRKKTTWRYKLRTYLSGSCNIWDLFIILIFTLSISARLTVPKDYFIICRSMYSICFGLFCIRTLQFYFAYEFFGPKVIMIRSMIRDMIFFLNVFVIFTISYGTLAQSMRFPNTNLTISLFHDIMQRPYFQAYGDLMLDKIFDESRCNDFQCSVKYVTVLLGFATYLLFTSILLVNLLIAMFGYSVKKVQKETDKHWSFLRLQLVEEFNNKPILPPPFNLLIYPCLLFEYYFCSWDNYADKKDYTLLNMTGFERVCMEKSMYENHFKSPGHHKKMNHEE